MLVRFLLFCGLCAVASSTLAMTLYRSTDARGVVFFSDQKTPGAQAFVFQERRAVPVKRQVLDPQPLRNLRPAQSQRYPLPWRGGPFRLTQGPGGTFSHSDVKSRYAMDIAMPEGTPIIAARGGVVVKTENSQSGRGSDPSGNFVRVLHDDGTQSVYLHLKLGSVSVREGQRVAVGSPLALSGNTGNSSGPHLHFVVQRDTGAGWVSIPYEFTQPVQALPNFASGTR
ncbi:MULTISPECIES: M23 family metallopeptidase [Pseudomonas]|uniref:Peptidoglycan DD-metalloendopeptidase family protein n=1 Tax=Pseudomonas proteolytica TaxID=219574 RepID=A0AAP6YK42_9PSED|nr:M23 family metallopeptidase [Pseudomonas proteolytica]OHW37236.1 peptidase [Pseudomonas sp. 06C 126]MCF5055412.1 peptidoglycan DD-metalloendopeptidase family protein [Pseudomonas proteolytica]MCF5099245.1 peptidoglycan DD-metalloendopeptidase family protein [Pseudomonas proteolytica]NMY94496.1 M23 family metallopeptidase [Pseudomonas proteolytica]